MAAGSPDVYQLSEVGMTKRLKYFAIYTVGFWLFVFTMFYAFDIAWSVTNALWLGLGYFIANMAGDIERIARYGDRA
jgi:hypothetical protein